MGSIFNIQSQNYNFLKRNIQKDFNINTKLYTLVMLVTIIKYVNFKHIILTLQNLFIQL